MVTQGLQSLFASTIAFGIRGSHVGREVAKDIPERHLVVDDLVVEGSRVQ